MRRPGGMFVRLLLALLVVGGVFGPAQPAFAGATDRLPDLVMDPLNNIRTEVSSSGQRRLRFGTIMVNRGDGPLEVAGERPAGQQNMTTRQKIYNTAGGSRMLSSRALMEYARDGHDHWHIQGVMLYQVWSTTGATQRGAKVGFCFLDSTWRGGPGGLAYRMADCGTEASTRNRMGLSVGWGDDYPWNFVYQWIDITALPSGEYTVQARADEQNWYLEKNENNNCAWARIRITAANGPVQVIEHSGSSRRTCLAPPASTAKVERQFGDDRYQTAGAISEDAFAPGVPVAYVATGEQFPDAISAAAAAGVGGGPVVLVRKHFVPALAVTELERLNPTRIVVVGGPGAVSDRVLTLVSKYQTGGGTTRLYGADRYETSAEVSEKTFLTPGVPVVYVASGENWPDALSASPHAARAGAPLLITRRDAIPVSVAAELDRLNPARIIVAGGPSVVSDEVVAQLESYDTGGGVLRLAGPDRYATAVELSKHHFPGTATFAYVATGANFPDALAAGPAAAKRGAPVLLTGRKTIPAVTQAELDRLNLRRIYVLGSPGVIAAGLDVTFQQWASGGP